MDDFDINFDNLDRKEILEKYEQTMRELREIGLKEFDISPLEFDSYVMHEIFRENSGSSGNVNVYRQILSYFKLRTWKLLLDRRRKLFCWLFYIFLVGLCLFLYQNQSTRDAAGRRIQAMSYPSMRLWRHITLPLIKMFPSLTELYDESCLLGNPFYEIDDLSCDKCADIEYIFDLTNEGNDIGNGGGVNIGSGDGADDYVLRKLPSEYVPYIIKYKQKPLQLSDFYNVYMHNDKIFQRDAYRVKSTQNDVSNLAELFHHFNNTETGDTNVEVKMRSNGRTIEAHNLWRCNRMLPARLMRSLFTRPALLPRTGLALERYIAIDTPKAPVYPLPETTCIKAFIQQAVGARFIMLRPTSECRHRCRPLSIRLPGSHVLVYNWLYYKPVSAPDPVSETISISLIGSYC